MTVGNCITGAWSFNYSSLNQLSGGTASAGPWSTLSLGWTYDAFGNRTGQTASASGSLQQPAPPSQSWIYNTNNQTTLSTYDPSGVGFVTGDVSNQYVYDNEGRLCAVSNVDRGSRQYVYDAEGRRVANGTIGLLSCNPANNGFALKESYILGQSGEHISELDGSGNFLRGHVYANGRLLATYTNADTEFTFSDWLGTKRVVANAAGSIAGTCINLPFGDELFCGGSVLLDGHHFTGQIHDAQSGNDYFGARYYSEYTGRFLTPDWSKNPQGVPYADYSNPQSLNLYGYVGNNPLSRTDVGGHAEELGNSDGWGNAVNGCGNGNSCTKADPGSIFTFHVYATDPTLGISRLTGPAAEWFLNNWHNLGPALGVVFSRSFGSSDGARSGKSFLRSKMREYLRKYAEENEGNTPPCTNCGQDTVPGQQRQAGVPRPGNEHQFDHTIPQSKGGAGDLDTNGDSMCATCNGVKGDSYPIMRPTDPPIMEGPVFEPSVPIDPVIIP